MRDDSSKAEHEAYKEFSAKMYQWSMQEEERRQTVSAISLYVYKDREKEGEKQDAD